MDSPPYPPPRLPWEVIERVIDHSRGRPKMLKSFALTCRQLLPRTRLAILARVRFKNRDHIFTFVDFLREHPHLAPIVRSIVVWPADFAPVPLLRSLPSLSEIRFRPGLYQNATSSNDVWLFPVLHQSNYSCFRLLGTHVRTLHLSTLQFDRLISFARLILAFPNITHLICHRTAIVEKPQSDGEPPSLPEVTKRQLSQRMKLTALPVDYDYLIAHKQATNLGLLLLYANSMSSRIERLTLKWYTEHGFLEEYHCDWSSLRSLTLQLSFSREPSRAEVVRFLEGMRKCPRLTDVTLEWQAESTEDLRYELLVDGATYKELDRTLLTFSRPRFICAFTRPLPINCGALWLGELRKHLPMMSEHGAVTFRSECGQDADGHGSFIWDFASSPDSKWVASGSDDSTIILWDADGGTIAQQWLAHGYLKVRTLAFSPDSQYLVSGGGDGSAAIWDLSHGARKVVTLEEHAEIAISACAWSPDGKAIATGSSDGTVRFWDARTFRQRASHQLAGQGDLHLVFSPNGRWLVCTSDRNGCSILSADSGTLHKFKFVGDDFLNDDFPFQSDLQVVSAAFDPRSTRLALTAKRSSARLYIIDIETGDTFLRAQELVDNISFSPDGRLVLGIVRNACYIWDAFIGIAPLRLTGHTAKVTKAVFSPCGRYAASASWDMTTRLWRTSDGSCLVTLSEHKGTTRHVAFSPNGKTLLSGGYDGRVIARRIQDIIPPINTDDDPSLIAPSPLPAVDPTPPTSPLLDSYARASPDEETDAGELHPKPEREEVSEPEERRIERGAASLGKLGQPPPTAGTFIVRDEEDEEGAAGDISVAGGQRAGSAARLSPRHSTAVKSEPIALDGAVSMSPARLSSITPMAHEASRAQGQPPARKAQENVDGAVPPPAPTPAGREASTSQVRPPTRATQEDANSAVLVQATSTVEPENATCSDSAVVGDGRAKSIRRSSFGDMTTNLTPNSFRNPADRETSRSRRRPSARESSDDVNAQAAPTVERRNAVGFAGSSIAPPMDRATNEPERRGVVDIRATCPLVPQRDPGWRRELVTKAWKVIVEWHRDVRGSTSTP